jgi:redox-sensitive bicupin YhaK (pirin superfamily)
VALPDGDEDGEPTFAHHPAAALPRRTADGIDLTVIAGQAFGLHSPVHTLWPTLYVHVLFTRGAALELPPGPGERAVYVVQGELEVDGNPLAAGQLAVLQPEANLTLRAVCDSRAMLLGGEPFPTPRYIWWNFVASSEKLIEAAKARWKRGEFPAVPGETEFIPLPNY